MKRTNFKYKNANHHDRRRRRFLHRAAGFLEACIKK
jgi:hypothetical protein